MLVGGDSSDAYGNDSADAKTKLNILTFWSFQSNTIKKTTSDENGTSGETQSIGDPNTNC